MKGFSGLFGDVGELNKPYFVQAEPLEERSKVYNWEIEEHFHNDLFQVFFIEENGGQYYLNKKRFEFVPFSVLLVPSNTVHGFRFDETVKGEVLTFSSRFWQLILKDRNHVEDTLKNSQLLTFIENVEKFKRIMEYLKLLKEELIEPSTENLYMVGSLIGIILTELYRSSKAENSALLANENKSLQYYRNFTALVKSAYDQRKQIRAYAKEIGISVVHLNRVCKEVSGETATGVMHKILISEAKNYLLNTDYSIAEVAYLLNFNDPAYFNRLFKKKVGVAPGVFRRG